MLETTLLTSMTSYDHSVDFDPGDPSLRPGSKPLSTNLRDFFPEIGRTLAICEAASFYVGIPWMFPTQRIRELRDAYEKPIEEFVKVSLSSVSTQVLEAYCDDLEHPLATENKCSLHILKPTFLERFGMSIGISFIAFEAVTFLLLQALVSIDLSLSIATIGAFLVCYVSTFFVSDRHRKQTFLLLLVQELERRRGGDGTFGRISISIKPDAVS